MKTLLILMMIAVLVFLIMRSRSRRGSVRQTLRQVAPEPDDSHAVVPDPTEDAETPTQANILAGQDSRVQTALAANIGCPAWIHGKVIRLRVRSDAVVDSVDDSFASIRRTRDGSITRLPLSELNGVALPKSKPAAELGHPIPGDGAKECDMMLVSDQPFQSVWPGLAHGNPYFWRSSETEQLASRMSSLAMIMFTADVESSIHSAANEVIETGTRILRLEPGHQDPYCAYLLGDAHLRLQNFDQARAHLERAFELHSSNRSLDEYSEKSLKRNLGMVLAILAVKTQDADLQRRAVALLSQLELSPDDPVSEILARLKE